MQQSRLPAVRVADDGHHRKGDPPATLAPQRPLLADLLDVFIELADAVTDAPPIAFQFLLPRAARPDARAQAGQVAPAHKPRQQMMQLRCLDLQTSLLGALAPAIGLDQLASVLMMPAVRCWIATCGLGGIQLTRGSARNQVSCRRAYCRTWRTVDSTAVSREDRPSMEAAISG